LRRGPFDHHLAIVNHAFLYATGSRHDYRCKCCVT